MGVDVGNFKNTYFEFNSLMNNNLLPYEEFWKKVIDKLDRSDKYAEVLSFLKGLPEDEINEEIIALADKLRVYGYKVGLLSNNSIEAREKFKKAGLYNHFDVIAISAEMGFSKPNPKAFEFFIKKLSINANELIFIDDTERSLINAGKIGFYPILFRKYNKLVRELESILAIKL